MLESATLVPDGLITHRMGIEGVPDALQLMARSAALKVLIEP
jgi:threonine dehydrogenase-like Zn-dependent dehydrogenase